MTRVLAQLPDAALAEAVGEVEGVEVVVAGAHDRQAEVEVLVAPYVTNVAAVDELPALPAVRFVQLQSAGFDGIPALLPPGTRLANAAGVHDDATAEHALGLVLASLRGIPEAVRQHGTWVRMPGRRSLADARVVVLGAGSIGRALAERLLACRAEVVAVASRARDGVDPVLGRVRGPEALPEVLPSADVLVVLLPLTDATRHAVDDALLARLPDGALVVNVARGPVVDTAAVLAHAGRLRFALDVTDPEPLLDGHPLWSAPDVLITPHVAGGTTAMLPRMAALARRQLAAYASGGPLAHVVAGPTQV